jgi:hypothetical protein
MRRTYFTAGIILCLLTGAAPAAEPPKPQGVPPAPTQIPDHEENDLVEQLSAAMVYSQRAVSCGLRSDVWHKNVLPGRIATLNMFASKIDDPDQKDLQIDKVIQSAKTQATLEVKSTPVECDQIKVSKELADLASAAIGMIEGSVHDQ